MTPIWNRLHLSKSCLPYLMLNSLENKVKFLGRKLWLNKHLSTIILRWLSLANRMHYLRSSQATLKYSTPWRIPSNMSIKSFKPKPCNNNQEMRWSFGAMTSKTMKMMARPWLVFSLLFLPWDRPLDSMMMITYHLTAESSSIHTITGWGCRRWRSYMSINSAK